MTDFDVNLMERMATMSQSAYTPTRDKRQRDLDARYSGEYKLLSKYSDKFHSTYQDVKNGDIILAIRGTDITNAQGGRINDLGTDVLVGFGLEKLSGR